MKEKGVGECTKCAQTGENKEGEMRGNQSGTATIRGGVCEHMSGVTDGCDSGEGDRKEREIREQ